MSYTREETVTTAFWSPRTDRAPVRGIPKERRLQPAFTLIQDEVVGMSVCSGVALIVFCGGNPKSDIERAMESVKVSITEDTFVKAGQTGSFSQAVLCSNYDAVRIPDVFDELHVIRTQSEGFHFGTSLLEAVNRIRAIRPLYMGGAAAPLLTADELLGAADCLCQTENQGIVITNNLHSSDIVGFVPSHALERIELPAIDNSLAYLLREMAGLRVVRLEESVGTGFDVDTPTDAAILGMHPCCSHEVSRAIDGLGYNRSVIERAKEVLKTAFSEVMVWGRVGPSLLVYLNKFTRCRWRVFSEERGMKALGRLKRGEVVSILGHLIQEVGISRFFTYLEGMCSLAFIDTRVLFAHMRLGPTAEDRFLSDAGRFDEIKDGFIRDFTKAAAEAEIPVVLGGHSLVAGGLRALVDSLWCEWYASKLI